MYGGVRSHLHTSLHCTIPATSSSQPKELPLTKNKPEGTEKGARAQTVRKGEPPPSELDKKVRTFCFLERHAIQAMLLRTAVDLEFGRCLA